MTVHEAIQDMRKRSADKRPFSFTFMSLSITRQASNGITTVRNARLRKRPASHTNRYSSIMEAYTDLDTLEARQFYQPLLISYNGQPVTL